MKNDLLLFTSIFKRLKWKYDIEIDSDKSCYVRVFNKVGCDKDYMFSFDSKGFLRSLYSDWEYEHNELEEYVEKRKDQVEIAFKALTKIID